MASGISSIPYGTWISKKPSIENEVAKLHKFLKTCGSTSIVELFTILKNAERPEMRLENTCLEEALRKNKETRYSWDLGEHDTFLFNAACKEVPGPIHWYLFHDLKRIDLSVRMRSTENPHHKYTIQVCSRTRSADDEVRIDGPRTVLCESPEQWVEQLKHVLNGEGITVKTERQDQANWYTTRHISYVEETLTLDLS